MTKYVCIVALIVTLIVTYFLRRQTNKKPSVLDDVYRKYAIEPLLLLGTFMYENPDNYSVKNNKLVATSPRLVLAEKQINGNFRDKIPWCLPPTYGDLEMHGAFPSVRTCRLGALCDTMMRNLSTFRSEFNEHKDQFVKNPENLGYGGHYGRIDIRKGRGFAKTREILGRSMEYNRTQAFNKYARYDFLSTTFTVLYPGGSIRPHFGPTNYKYRIHLCVDIDGIGGIVTAYGTRLWETGSIFILDDSYLHAGFYEGTRPRVIIMVDIAKPGLTFEHVDNIFEHVDDDAAMETLLN